MTLHPSSALQRVRLPSSPASSLPDGPDPESDSLRAASATVTRFLATTVTDPSFESVIVTIGLNVPKTKDRVHRRISAERLQTLIAFCSQL
ncbi:unnamed protein product [Closterium sp. NIES-54]